MKTSLVSPHWWLWKWEQVSVVLMVVQLGHQQEEKLCSMEVRCETALRHCTLCWKGLHLGEASLLLCFELSRAPVSVG